MKVKPSVLSFFFILLTFLLFSEASFSEFETKNKDTNENKQNKDKEGTLEKKETPHENHLYKSKSDFEKELKEEVEKELKEELDNINRQVEFATKDLRRPKKKKPKSGGLRSGGFMEIIQISGPDDDFFSPFQIFELEVQRPHASHKKVNKTKKNKTKSKAHRMEDELKSILELDEMFNNNNNSPFEQIVIGQKKTNLQVQKVLPVGNAING